MGTHGPDAQSVVDWVVATPKAPLAGTTQKGNRPYLVGGTPVRDRLSFYFTSRCAITKPGSTVRVGSEDMRAAGCR